MKKATLLIVDDVPENLDVLIGILEPVYNIQIATNGERAISIAGREEKPDVILLDIIMPGMNGYEVCQQLKSDDSTKDIPIIFVTAKNEVEDESKGFDLGAVDYITKPVSSSIVLKRIETQLRIYDTNRFLTEKVDEQTRELRDLTSKLLYVQEEERKRIARELHDDLSQRMAALSIKAGNLEQKTESEEQKSELRDLHKALVNVATDIHGLSRRLHPSILDDLGLVDALRSEIDSFKEREGIFVNFDASEAINNLSSDVELSLFRIVQESLRNIIKYSAASHVNVELKDVDNTIYLSVQDNGMGFDVPSAMRSPGLGLQSMRERAKLINGDLKISSVLNEGTKIEIKIEK